MELWLFPGIMAMTIWASIAVFDKYMVSYRLHSFRPYALLYGLQSIFVLLFVPFFGLSAISDIPLMWVGMAAVQGLLYTLFLIILLKATQLEEVSRVMMLTQLSPLLVMPFAALFLGEVLGGFEIAALVLLVFGGLLASHRRGVHFLPRSSFLAIGGTILMLVLMRIVVKSIYQHVPYETGFFWIRMFTFLFSLLFVLWWRAEFREMTHHVSKRMIALVIVIVFIDFLGLALENLAISLGPVSLVAALGGLLPVLTFLFALALARHFPQQIREDVSPRVVVKKSVAVAVIAAAVVLLNV